MWYRVAPVSIILAALALPETGTLQMMGGIAYIDSNRSKVDTTVAHNTTSKLSTVL